MQSSEQKLVSIPSRCIVYLAPLPDRTFNGRVFSEYYRKTFQFDNELEMTMGMNDLFDSIGFPQAAYQPRSFFDKQSKQTIRKAEDTLDSNLDEMLENQKVTFIVNVQYRQNATWQGSITWVEQNRTQHFRSTFEMMQLMDEAAHQGEANIISWED